ncbi:hypothetical protein BAUCODRAFT_539281 [Baudoinia panamericana UAMH 10762]|uniref:DUF2470 domain-containing protein n=1 Tax=Baudoinia panamericana (strain UAMH 10762) TaxID=717646 RepID=M2MUY3_BAUPA|nr:uncharacterized protein BAUCODRAFT_539281 [Baudoinia panamericana UAMH 10762]EMC95393.1 hypothetical protein BAUCODRAFT_539281 [Baudoinia panamericana UAMH 10762]
MADPDAKDNAAKSRIVTHMNEDHHNSIVRYLEHYHKLYSWQAYDARMSGVDLSGMTFVCRGHTYRIPFQPPLASYKDARERVVQMDKDALRGLGRSDVAIKEFLPPTGFYLVNFIAVSATMVAYSQRWWFAKGHIVERIIGSGFARFSWTIQPYLIGAMLAIHLTEMLYFMTFTLPKHSVNPRTSTFWKWAAVVFVEGVGAQTRFANLVKVKQEAKAKQQH